MGMTTKKPRPRGRPKLGKRALMSPIMVRFPRDLLEQVDASAAERIDRPERSSVIRELCREALAARKKRVKR